MKSLSAPRFVVLAPFLLSVVPTSVVVGTPTEEEIQACIQVSECGKEGQSQEPVCERDRPWKAYNNICIAFCHQVAVGECQSSTTATQTTGTTSTQTSSTISSTTTTITTYTVTSSTMTKTRTTQTTSTILTSTTTSTVFSLDYVWDGECRRYDGEVPISFFAATANEQKCLEKCQIHRTWCLAAETRDSGSWGCTLITDRTTFLASGNSFPSAFVWGDVVNFQGDSTDYYLYCGSAGNCQDSGFFPPGRARARSGHKCFRPSTYDDWTTQSTTKAPATTTGTTATTTVTTRTTTTITQTTASTTTTTFISTTSTDTSTTITSSTSSVTVSSTTSRTSTTISGTVTTITTSTTSATVTSSTVTTVTTSSTKTARPPCRVPDEFETYPETPSSDRVCQDTNQCAPISNCSGTIDDEIRCNTIHRFEITPPTYFTDRECAPVTQCTDGITMETVAPTFSSDRECGCIPGKTFALEPESSNCSSCRQCDDELEYMEAECTTTSNRMCLLHPICIPVKEYEATPATRISPRVCKPVSSCDLTTTYIVAEATSTTDVLCANITTCPMGTREVLPASTFQDTQCQPCDGLSEFQDLPDQKSCKAVAPCANDWYEIEASTSTSDRQCSACRVCDELSGFVEATPCTEKADRTCRALNDCGPQEYRPSNDQQNPCTPLTICSSDHYEVLPRPSGSDRQCAKIKDCPAGTYESLEPTQTSDRGCISCVSGLTFTEARNQVSCSSCTSDCPKGHYLLPCAIDKNSKCILCGEGTFKSDVSLDSCQTWSEPCGVGQEEKLAPSAINDRECRACSSGTYRSSEMVEQGFNFCRKFTDCRSGFIPTGGNRTHDRTCTSTTTVTTTTVTVTITTTTFTTTRTTTTEIVLGQIGESNDAASVESWEIAVIVAMGVFILGSIYVLVLYQKPSGRIDADLTYGEDAVSAVETVVTTSPVVMMSNNTALMGEHRSTPLNI